MKSIYLLGVVGLLFLFGLQPNFCFSQVCNPSEIQDTICLQRAIFPQLNDTTPGDNQDILKLPVVNSYDPNDRQVSPFGEESDGKISQNTPLLPYTIRFQNTDNDTAFAVIIRDEIDSTLDLSTLQTIASSHNNCIVVEEGQRILDIQQYPSC